MTSIIQCIVRFEVSTAVMLNIKCFWVVNNMLADVWGLWFSSQQGKRFTISPNYSGQLLGYVHYSVGSRGTKYTTYLTLVL